MADQSPTRKVKVYVLNDEGSWDDRATGHVLCDLDPSTKTYVLKVTTENTGQLALCTTLRSSHRANYQMNQKIISWNEPSFASVSGNPPEVALSFAEEDDCRDVWEKICLVDSNFKNIPVRQPSIDTRQNVPTPPPASNALVVASSSVVVHNALDDAVHAAISNSPDAIHPPSNPGPPLSLADPAAPEPPHASRFLDDHLEPVWGTTETFEDVLFQENANVLFLTNPTAPLGPSNSAAEVVSNPPFIMPTANRSGIEILSKFITHHNVTHFPSVRERINTELSSGDYIDKLCQLFRTAEQAADFEFLVHLYVVTRFFFVVADNKVLEALLCERCIMDVVGCLEYAPDQIAALVRSPAMGEPTEERTGQISMDTGQSDLPNANPTAPNSEQPTSASASEVAANPSKPTAILSSSVNETNDRTDQIEKQWNPESTPMEDTQQTPAETTDNVQQLQVLETSSAPISTETYEPTPGSSSSKVAPAVAQKSTSEETTTSSGNIIGEVENSSPNFNTHRNFLQRKALYKVVVPINDSAVLAKIHQNFRAAYIRDVILRPIGENALSGVILFNNVDIIMYFISGNALQELFESLKVAVQTRRARNQSPATSREMQQSMLDFLGGGDNSKASTEQRPSNVVVPIIVHNAPKNSEDSKDAEDSKDFLPVENISGQPTQIDSTVGNNEGKETVTSQAKPSDINANITGTSNPVSKEPTSQEPQSDAKIAPDSATADPKSSEPGEVADKDLWSMLKFLKELCRIVKGQQAALKNRFHTLLLELGFFEIAVGLLRDEDVSLRSLCCEILWSVIMHDQAEVRTHVLKNATQKDSSVARASGVPKLASLPTTGSLEVDPLSNGITAEFDLDNNQASKIPNPSAADAVDVGKVSFDGDSTPGNVGTDPSDLRKLAEVALHGNEKQTTETELCGNATKGGLVDTNPQNATPLCMNLTEDSHGGITDSSDKQMIVSVPNVVTFTSRSQTDFPLLGTMIDVICTEEESGVAMSTLDLLRSLLDPTNMRTKVENSLFLNVFYEKFIVRLLPPIEQYAVEDEIGANISPFWVASNIGHVIDLLSFCLRNHMYMCKAFVIQNDVGSKVMRLAKHRKPHVQLSASRFLRACIGMQDDMMDRYLLRRKLLDPLMEMFSRNGNRDNMVSSVVLELLRFVQKEKRLLILDFVVTFYREILESSTISRGTIADLIKELRSAANEQRTLSIMGMMDGNERVVPQGRSNDLAGTLAREGTGRGEVIMQAAMNAQMNMMRSREVSKGGKATRAIKRGVSGIGVLAQILDGQGQEGENVVAAMIRMMDEYGTIQFQRIIEARRRMSRQMSRDGRNKVVGDNKSASGNLSPVLKLIEKQRRGRGGGSLNSGGGRVANRSGNVGLVTGLRSKAVDAVVNNGLKNDSGRPCETEKRSVVDVVMDEKEKGWTGSCAGDEDGVETLSSKAQGGSSGESGQGVVAEGDVRDQSQRRFKLSLSKSASMKSRGRDIQAAENMSEDGWISESSSEGGVPGSGKGRRDRVVGSGREGIETSTRSVLGRRKSDEGERASEDVLTKRRRRSAGDEGEGGAGQGGTDDEGKMDAKRNASDGSEGSKVEGEGGERKLKGEEKGKEQGDCRGVR